MYAYGAAIGGSFTGGFFGALGSVGSAAGWGTGWAAATGAGFGFGSSFANSLLNGSSLSDAFKMGIVGGVVGGVSAGIASKIGTYAEGHEWFRGVGGQDWTHGLAQGALTEATGGEFRHGFYAGFVSSASAPAVQRHAPGGLVGQTAAAAVAGGTASALGGGKFVNGAASGAFTYLFNQAAHELSERLVPELWGEDWDKFRYAIVNPDELEGKAVTGIWAVESRVADLTTKWTSERISAINERLAVNGEAVAFVIFQSESGYRYLMEAFQNPDVSTLKTIHVVAHGYGDLLVLSRRSPPISENRLRSFTPRYMRNNTSFWRCFDNLKLEYHDLFDRLSTGY